MDFGLESLILSLAFLLPGFITSRLINIKTQNLKVDSSSFEETAESLLRSIYIHLSILPFFLIFIRIYLLIIRPTLLQDIYSNGLLTTLAGKPFLSAVFIFSWLILSFLLAIIFGYFWDPLDFISQNIAKKHNTLSNDFYFDLVKKIKKEYGSNTQIWIQARLTNGFTYRGELSINSFKNDNNNREIILQNVKFFPKPIQVDTSPTDPPKKYDFVILNTANCLSIEILKYLPN